MKTIKIPFLAGFVAVLFLSEVKAQENSVNSLAINKENDAQVISLAIGVTPDESKNFLPVYLEYQKELNALKQKNEALGRLSSSEISDDEAWLGVDELLKFERDKVNLKRKYANSFRKVLPPKKAARYFLLQSKMDSVSGNDLSGNLPATVNGQ